MKRDERSKRMVLAGAASEAAAWLSERGYEGRWLDGRPETGVLVFLAVPAVVHRDLLGRYERGLKPFGDGSPSSRPNWPSQIVTRGRRP